MTGRRITMAWVAVGWFWIVAPGAFAQDEQAEKGPTPGWQLMSEQERDQYRIAMHVLQTEEERMAMRAKHQKEMRARAIERNIELSGMRTSGSLHRRGPDAADRGRVHAPRPKRSRERPGAGRGPAGTRSR